MTGAQTEAYRKELVATTTAAVLYSSQQLQLAFDAANVLVSFESWLDGTVGLLDAAANQAIARARIDYFETRLAAGVGGVDPLWRPQPLSIEALRRSMYATAGQTLQGIERFRSDPDRYPMVAPGAALKRARIQAAGVATRQVMNAARNSTIATARGDRRAIGAVYLTKEDAKVCSWCLMLASRGPVFGSDSFEDSDGQFVGTGTAKSHDNCRCVLRVAYTDDSPLLNVSHRLYEEWKKVTRDEQGRIRLSGRRALNAWRSHVAANDGLLDVRQAA